MDRENVVSSNILSIGYDSEEETLEVEFMGGKIYQYFGVPEEVKDELLSASSIGSYFYYNVRTDYEYLLMY